VRCPLIPVSVVDVLEIVVGVVMINVIVLAVFASDDEFAPQ
jgi:hypothetical protein